MHGFCGSIVGLGCSVLAVKVCLILLWWVWVLSVGGGIVSIGCVLGLLLRSSARQLLCYDVIIVVRLLIVLCIFVSFVLYILDCGVGLWLLVYCVWVFGDLLLRFGLL